MMCQAKKISGSSFMLLCKRHIPVNRTKKETGKYKYFGIKLNVESTTLKINNRKINDAPAMDFFISKIPLISLIVKTGRVIIT